MENFAQDMISEYTAGITWWWRTFFRWMFTPQIIGRIMIIVLWFWLIFLVLNSSFTFWKKPPKTDLSN